MPCRKPEENQGVPSHQFPNFSEGSRCECGEWRIQRGYGVRCIKMAENVGSDPT